MKVLAEVRFFWLALTKTNKSLNNMVDLKKAEAIFKKLQEFDNELCDLILSDDGSKKVISGYSSIMDLRTCHQKYIDLCRSNLKSAQTCIKEIILDLKK